MISICRYTQNKQTEWDDFIKVSKNGTFLFLRSYMDYHSDRFFDHSLLFYIGNHLHSVLPAHEVGDIFCSHRGLTYGGLLMDEDVTTADVLVLFEELNTYLRQSGFKKVLYRTIPWVYHRLPAEEDLYAIFWKCGARLQQRMSGTVIFMDANLRWRKDHRRRLKQAQMAGVKVVRDAKLAEFWPVLNDNLQRKFQAQSVHTLQEIELLKSRFPDKIIQYNAYLDDKVIGGITFYVMGHVLHGQYSGTTDEGIRLGAMEAIYDQVMYRDYAHMRYLDFGTSNEQGGLVLNEGLIAHKEGYGGRTVMYDTYEWIL